MRSGRRNGGFGFRSGSFNRRGENVKYVVVRCRGNSTRIINTKRIIQTCRHQGLCACARIAIYIVIASYVTWILLRETLKSLSGNK